MNKILSFVAVILVVIVGAQIVSAQTATNLCASNPSYDALTGWAWSSNVGWISFNSSNAGSGGGNYKVCVSPTGDMGGYAWSSNVGWVSFEGADVSSCPSGVQARVNLTSGSSRGTVSGWARVLSGKGRTDGWDGCIKLAGTDHPSVPGDASKGVSMNPSNGAFAGYAWGSNVIGWVQFDTIPGNTVRCTTNCGGTPVTPITASCTFTSPQTIPSGQTDITLTPTVSGYSGGSGSSYGFTPASFFGVTAGVYAPGAFVVTIHDGSTPQKTANIDCGAVTVNGGGTPPGSVATLKIGRTVAGATADALAATKGDQFALKWTNSAVEGVTCAATVTRGGTPDTTNWSTWTSVSSDDLRGSGNVFPVQTNSTMTSGTYKFKISCDNGAADDVDLILNSVIQIEI
jgi:hypothetical protein